MTETNIEKHKRFMAMLSSGQPIPIDLVAWYQVAVDRHVTEGVPLCSALGLRGPGIRSPKRRGLMWERNVLLMYLAQSVRCHIDSGLWHRCGIAVDLINRYPRSKNENALLKALFDLGIDIPKTQSGVFRCVLPLRCGNRK